MKRLIIISMVLVFLTSACKKEIHDAVDPLSGMYVINGILGGVTVKVNPGISSGFAYSRASFEVGYGVGTYYNVKQGSRAIVAVNALDTTKTLFSRIINFQQKINTLYLFGQYPAVDTLFREEKDIPYVQTTLAKPDSVIYIRFVNLSPNAGPVNVKVVGGTSNEVSALAYKGISPFKLYSANYRVTAPYVFQVIDAANSVLASATVNQNTNRYKTITLVLRGQVNPNPALPNPYPLGIAQVNYF